MHPLTYADVCYVARRECQERLHSVQDVLDLVEQVIR
jgi:hypothetical protein